MVYDNDQTLPGGFRKLFRRYSKQLFMGESFTVLNTEMFLEQFGVHIDVEYWKQRIAER